MHRMLVRKLCYLYLLNNLLLGTLPQPIARWPLSLHSFVSYTPLALVLVPVHSLLDIQIENTDFRQPLEKTDLQAENPNSGLLSGRLGSATLVFMVERCPSSRSLA